MLVALLALAVLSSGASPASPSAACPRPWPACPRRWASRSPRPSGPSPTSRRAPRAPASEAPAASPCPTSPPLPRHLRRGGRGLQGPDLAGAGGHRQDRVRPRPLLGPGGAQRREPFRLLRRPDAVQHPQRPAQHLGRLGHGRGRRRLQPGPRRPGGRPQAVRRRPLARQAHPPGPLPERARQRRLHVALKRYNNACWYVHEVVTLAGRYTSSSPPVAPSKDRSCAPWSATGASPPRQPRLRLNGPGLGQARPAGAVAAGGDRRAPHHPARPAQPLKFVKGTTRVSNHTVWRAVDIDIVDGRPVSRSSRAARSWWCGWTGWRARCGPRRSARRGRSATAPTSPTRATRATCTWATGSRPREWCTTAASSGRGQDPVDLGVAVGQGHEPGLEGARGQVDAALQHGVEEAGIGGGVLAAGGVVVAHLVGGQEDAEQVAGALRAPGAGRLEGVGQPVAEGDRQAVQVPVGVVVEQRQGGQAGRGGQRVPGQVPAW